MPTELFRPARTPAHSSCSMQNITLVASAFSVFALTSATVFSSSPSVRSALPSPASLCPNQQKRFPVQCPICQCCHFLEASCSVTATSTSESCATNCALFIWAPLTEMTSNGTHWHSAWSLHMMPSSQVKSGDARKLLLLPLPHFSTASRRVEDHGVVPATSHALLHLCRCASKRRGAHLSEPNTSPAFSLRVPRVSFRPPDTR